MEVKLFPSSASSLAHCLEEKSSWNRARCHCREESLVGREPAKCSLQPGVFFLTGFIFPNLHHPIIRHLIQALHYVSLELMQRGWMNRPLGLLVSVCWQQSQPKRLAQNRQQTSWQLKLSGMSPSISCTPVIGRLTLSNSQLTTTL